MTLTRTLLKSMLTTAAVIVGVGFLVSWLLFGEATALAVLIGGLVVGGSGALQIWMVGFLLDPDQPTPQKAAVGLLLVFKLVLVAAILWGVMTRLSPDGVGLLIGMALGLGSLVMGVSRASGSPEAEAAMEEARRKIADKEEDTNDERG